MAEKGLTKVNEIYQNRDKRVKELKNQGEKIIGYLCCYVPLEMLTAAGLIPYRITGDTEEPITKADECLITNMCSFVRSFFDIGLKGRYNFLDGLVVPHTCQDVERIYELWKYYLNPTYSYFLDVPHNATPLGYTFFKNQLASFKKSLENFSGRAITDQVLLEQIELYNENRQLMRKLYELRKQEPPLLSGSDITEIIVASMSIPVEESNQHLKDILKETKEHKVESQAKKPRLLIWGPPLDDKTLIQLIEECDANIVMDDVCFGSRFYWADVEVTDDPLGALAERYLFKIRCPRTFWPVPPPGGYRSDIENRLGYILDYVREFNVEGAILATPRFCVIHGHDFPDLRDYLKEAGLSVLSLDYDYSTTSIAPLKTRIQAFIETLG